MTRTPRGAADRPFAHLAEHLTALRRTARLPQRTVVQAASISRGAVQRAESGTTAPTLAVLDAYVRACGGRPDDLARARALRARGRTAQRDRLRCLDAPNPALIHTADDLGAALAAAYERAGAPPLRDLDLPGRAPVPPTTAWRIVNRKGLPATVRQMLTFLTACNVHPAQQRTYIDAYHRITASLHTRPTPPPAQRASDGRRAVVRLASEVHHEQQHLAAALAPGLQVFAAALGQMDVRPEKLVPAVGTLIPALSRLLGQEARRNGRSLSDTLAAGVDPFAAALPHLLPAIPLSRGPRRTENLRLTHELAPPDEPFSPALITTTPPPNFPGHLAPTS
ncbi:helix-turn-helix domain-containing protein [Streptomyces prunicolor]|uniref:helix-turn-helix domain-containing protein n=1 Tax=Streptomyces prunicolor TaxID=67348 RepID=UPI00037AEEC6|nr:helix-turn-helix transcriptional regulator [Streptomyces prunicolor]